jgi:hypothetical protein
MIKTQQHANKVKAGRAGGLRTLEKYGREHLSQIGKKGAAVFHKRYRFEAVDLNDFAIVRRDTREVIAFLSGRPF